LAFQDIDWTKKNIFLFILIQKQKKTYLKKKFKIFSVRQKPITISISQNIDTGLQPFNGYIYGLRVDLIGQYYGVGLHRFYFGPVFQALTGYIYGLRMDLIGQFDGVGLHRVYVIIR
jgi:hypothetical protein